MHPRRIEKTAEKRPRYKYSYFKNESAPYILLVLKILLFNKGYQNVINGTSGFTYVYFRVIKNTGTAQMLQGGGTGSTVSHNGGVVMSNGNNFRGMGQYYTDA